MGTHTFRQTLKYEVARDLLNGRIADISEQIAIEEAKPAPAPGVIEQLEDSMADVGGSISRLDVTDEAGLDAVIAANWRKAPTECTEGGDRTGSSPVDSAAEGLR